jgi:hypothetical protein
MPQAPLLVHGQIKEQQGARRFMRRGMRACQAEWKLLCGTHNLLKLWRHTATQQVTRPATASGPPSGLIGATASAVG